MPDIPVICGKCGTNFSVPDNMGGLIATCPTCGSQISVPLPADRPSPAVRLQLKRDQPVGGGKPCPACGVLMAEDAVLCVHCGYNTQTGRRVAESPSRTASWLSALTSLAGLAILAGLAWTFLQYTRAPREPPRNVPVQEPVVTGAEPVASPSPPPEVAAPTVSVEAAATTTATQTVEAATTSAVPAKPSAEELEKAAEALRAKLTQQLDARNPLYRVGEQVTLRRMNGQVYRGRLQAVSTNAVVLDVEGNRTEVPLASLDQASRVRCDEAFRRRVIEYEVQRRVKEWKEF